MKCPQLSKPEATAARNQTPSVTEWRKNLERNQAQSGGQFSGQKKTAVQFQPQQSLYSPYSEYEYEEITKTQFQSVREVKDKNNNQRPTQMSLCVCGSDRDSAETLMDSLSSCFSWLMLWPLWFIKSEGFIYMILFQTNMWQCYFTSSFEQLQDQFSHCDSDWRRFLYDSLSLCEHIFTVDVVETLTVIMSSIFSLDSTDGQSEITVRSTATESRWSSWLKGACSINQEFRSFSRFL